MKKFAFVFVSLIVLIEHSSAAATGSVTEQQQQQQQQQQQSSVTLDLPFKINEDCHQPRETGRCFALFHRFAFNVEKRVCEEFIYGGCGGNKNNFETLAECENICRILADEELLITTTTVAPSTNSSVTTASEASVGVAVRNEQQPQNVADDSAPTPASTSASASESTNSP